MNTPAQHAGKLSGKVVLITGGARGQGAAEGAMFVAEGATVHLSDVLESEGAATASAIGATFHQHDVSSQAQWATVVDDIVATHGRIDVLVNNAGILPRGTLSDTPLDVWERVIAINQTGVFLGMQTVAPHMRAQRSGSIINVSSTAGMKGVDAFFAYSATKWAVRGMTKGAAKDLGPHGVRVNSIHPGIIDTPMVVDQPIEESARQVVPLRRVASADEVARLALWLASDDSSYSTGAEFVIDGGLTT